MRRASRTTDGRSKFSLSPERSRDGRDRECLPPPAQRRRHSAAAEGASHTQGRERHEANRPGSTPRDAAGCTPPSGPAQHASKRATGPDCRRRPRSVAQGSSGRPGPFRRAPHSARLRQHPTPDYLGAGIALSLGSGADSARRRSRRDSERRRCYCFGSPSPPVGFGAGTAATRSRRQSSAEA